MKKYKFKKDKDHYKIGDIIETEKPNKLLKQLLKDGIVEVASTTKAKK